MTWSFFANIWFLKRNFELEQILKKLKDKQITRKTMKYT